MQPTNLLLILALVASIQARDDWSWGPDEFLASSSSSSSSSVSGRSSFFPSVSKDDHNVESSIQTEIIQPSVQRAAAVQTVRAPRLIQAFGTALAVQAVQVTPAPVSQSSFIPSFSKDDHNVESFIQTEIIQPSVQRAAAVQTVRAPRLIQAFGRAPAVQAVQVTPAQATAAPHSENRSGIPRGDGQSEGRFLGIKEKLCEVGIGFDCKKGYDSHSHHNSGGGISVYDVSYVQPIQVVPVGGHIPAIPVQKGYQKGHHQKLSGSGISAYDVSYVQPIQVVPVGGHIAAVPVQKGPHKGHHQKAHYSPPAYHPPQPAYHPPTYGAPQPTYGAPQPTYGAPQPTYGAPKPTYGAPAPVYNPPKATYSPPASSYSTPSHSSYTPPKASYGQGGSTVAQQHVHTHHHVYNGLGSQGGYALRKDNNYGSSNTNSVGTSFNTFSSSIKKIGNSLPAIPPRQGFLTPTTQRPAYREDCQCVETQYCSSFDIVGRSNNLLPLLDARTRKTDILSTSTDEEGSVLSSNIDDQAFSASETHEHIEEPNGVSQDKQEAERTKRDIISIVVDDIGIEPAVNPTNRQGRQLQFHAYTPGLSGCAASHVCCRAPVFRSQRDVGTCGRRSSVGVLGRVKNTRFEKGDTEFGEYPWQAAILRKEGGDNVYVCGGVLIDTRHLLTAAHCVNGLNPSDLKVRLGEWDVSSETEFYHHIESPVSGVYTHPEFYSGNLNNDIAVLRLFSPVDLATSPHISPVCLPDRFAIFTSQRCHVTGWGKNAFGDTGDFQHLLKEVDLPMVDHSLCESALRRIRLGGDFNLPEGMVCAGGEEGKDACEGDGGSPLVCRGQDGTVQLAGLVSWGVGCGRRGVPGVYTNIPYYLTWISSITRV